MKKQTGKKRVRVIHGWVVLQDAWRGIGWIRTNEPRFYEERSHAEYYAGFGKIAHAELRYFPSKP